MDTLGSIHCSSFLLLPYRILEIYQGRSGGALVPTRNTRMPQTHLGVSENLGVPYVGVLTIRILLFRVLY